MFETTFKHPNEPYITYKTEIYKIGDGFVAAIGHKRKHIFVCIGGNKYKEVIVEYVVDTGSITVLPKSCEGVIKKEEDIMLYLEEAYGYYRK